MAIKFGTSGWRGIISDDFTFHNVRLVTKAIANYLRSEGIGKRGVVIGYDTRFLSKEFAIASCDILSQDGIPVWLTDRDTPTPVISYHIIKKKSGGGINFTASHNPPEYNGLKFSPSHGGPAEPEVTSKIEKEIGKLLYGISKARLLRYARNDYRFLSLRGQSPWQSNLVLNPRIAAIGSKTLQTLDSLDSRLIRPFNPAPQYLKHIKSLIRMEVLRKAKLKVVIDCMHGTSRGYLDNILKESGCSVHTLNTNLDPMFGGHRPEPAEENIIGLKNEVRKSRADIGLSTDGDGDRFGIIDSDGTYITPNQVICLLFDYLVKRRLSLPLSLYPRGRGQGEGDWVREKVARSVATTSMVDAIAKRHGIEVVETPVGFKFIGRLISEGDCIIGGEESGGLSIGGHLPEKDGILACLLVAEMVASVGQPIRDILKRLYKEVGKFYGERLDIHLTQETKDKLLNRLKTNPPEKIAGMAVSNINRIDGFKFILNGGSWVLFRPSGTEPIVRIYLESSSSAKLKKMIEEVRKYAPICL